MVFDLAFNNILSVQGIIGFCPGKPRNFDVNIINNKDIKLYMLGGETDFYLERQKQMAELFEQAGIAYIHDIIPGMGHAFPQGLSAGNSKGVGLYFYR